MIGGMWMWTGEQETMCVVFWCVVMDSGNATKPEEIYIFVIRFPNLDTSVSFSLLNPLFTKDHFDFILLLPQIESQSALIYVFCRFLMMWVGMAGVLTAECLVMRFDFSLQFRGLLSFSFLGLPADCEALQRRRGLAKCTTSYVKPFLYIRNGIILQR